MSVSKPLYSKEEFARRGDEIYEPLAKLRWFALRAIVMRPPGE